MKKVLALVLATAMVFSLAACASKAEQAEAAVEEAVEAAEVAEKAEEAAAEAVVEAVAEEAEKALSDLTIGIVVFASTAQSSQKQVEATKQACDEVGAKMIDLYAEGDKEEMLNCIEQLIEADVDAIIMQPVSVPGQGVLEEIQAAGIMCCIFDADISDSGYGDTGLVISNWTSNNKMAGELAAQDAVKRANGKTVNCLCMNSPTGQPGEVARCAGWLETIEKEPTLNLLEDNATLKDDKTLELQLAEDWVNKYDDIGGFFSFHDNGAMAMVQALKANGRLTDDIYIYGVDGNQEALESIKIGELTGTVVQQSGLMAYNSCQDVFKTYLGEPIDHDFTGYIDVILVTEENVDEYLN